jgi:hypothetical protein
MTRHHDLWQAVPIKQGLWRSLFGAPPARSTSSAILGVDLQEFKNAAEACEEVRVCAVLLLLRLLLLVLLNVRVVYC